MLPGIKNMTNLLQREFALDEMIQINKYVDA